MTLRSACVAGLVQAGVAATMLLAATPGARAADLTVALPDGMLGRVLSEAFVTPFGQATGLSVAVALTDGSVAAARAAHADILVLSAGALAVGCKDGALVKLDWSALGGRDRQAGGTASDCGEGAALRSVVLAWNRDKFPGTPGWGEFWDVAKVPGKRGLRRDARGNLELALMADGVSASDVYATLRTDAGVDRAFRKLDQLKPYLVWWQGDDEAAKLLEGGQVLMTSAPAEDIIAAERGQGMPAQPGFAVQWAGSLASVESWAALAAPPSPAPATPAVATPAPPAQAPATPAPATPAPGAPAPGAPAAAPAAPAPGPSAAGRFLMFVADPRNQRRLPALGGFGGAAQGANDGLSPELLAASPSAPANLQAALMIDDGFWRDNGAKLDRLFEAWIAK